MNSFVVVNVKIYMKLIIIEITWIMRIEVKEIKYLNKPIIITK